MDTGQFLADYGVYLGSFIVCVISGIIPLISTELFLIGVMSLSAEPPIWWLLVLLGTAGEMSAKIVMYFAGRGVLNLATKKYEAALTKWRARFARRGWELVFFIFVSGFVGLPPFFVIAILAGSFRVNFAVFALIGSAGRYLRFAVCVLFPLALEGVLF